LFLRFWADADEESEEESNSGGEEEEQRGATGLERNFAYAVSDSESDDEVKRKVVSKKEKYTEDLKDALRKLHNFIKISDWKSVVDTFADVQSRTDKANKTHSKANNTEGVAAVTKLWVKTIISVEAACEESWSTKKSLNKDQQRALTKIRQGVKKMTAGEYKDRVEQQKAAGDSEEEEFEASSEEDSDSDSNSDSDSDSDSDEDEEEKPKKKDVAKKKADSDSDESEDWGSDSDDSDSSSEDDEDAPAVGKRGTREFWLLRAPTDKKNATAAVIDKKEKPVAQKVDKQDPGQQKVQEEVTWTPAMVDKELEKIIAERGRKGTNKLDQVDRLEKLCLKVKTDTKKIEVLVHVISCLFDTGANMLVPMDPHVWDKTAENITTVLQLLAENPEFKLLESQDFAEDMEDDMAPPPVPESSDPAEEVAKPVRANLLGFLERLDDELTKSYQALDPQTTEYSSRIQAEKVILSLAAKIEEHYRKLEQPRPMAAACRRRVEHLYYRTQTMKKIGGEKYEEFSKMFEELCVLVYRHGDERTKARTMLCHVYHEAQRGSFFKARDMLLMSHLQESIHQSDINTQILFNRTMVQLGLCAFTHGLVQEAHGCLSEVLAGSRVKELLAQGITSSRYTDRNPEQEKEERRRQIPFHMHINLELLEGVHLVCAMLLEVPNMAETPLDMSKRKLISKSFRRTLDHMERQLFTGPPENTRDTIMTASKALMRGNWRKCWGLIEPMKIWALIPSKDDVLALVHDRIQEEGLRTFLFTYSPYYDSLSLEELCTTFEMKKTKVHSIMSKMMINEELHASWDQPTNCIVMNQVEPTRLQSLALQFAEKANTFVENNEKLLDFRTGGYGFKYDNKDRKERTWEDRQSWDRQSNYRRGGGGGGRRDYNNRDNYNNNRNHDNDNRDNRGGGGGYQGRRW